MKPSRPRAKIGSFRLHQLGVSVVILVCLGISSCWGEGNEELLQISNDPKISNVEKALRSLEAKLNEVGPSTSSREESAPGPAAEHVAWERNHGALSSKSDVSDKDVVMHAAPQSTGLEKSVGPEEVTDRKPGSEWTAADQKAYDAEMTRALGFSGPIPKEDHMPAMFLPLASLPLQRDYAHNLVQVLQNMKQGYLEELLQWAVSGHQGENPFITPIVETLEAPLIKDLDREAHVKVESTVAHIAKRKNLSAAQTKSMRARLLVPLLLRIRARVHQQVQTYVVSMLRRIILYGSNWKSGGNFNSHGILAPEAGSPRRVTDDEHMEYTLRDIDALYEKGVLSKRDYQAEKAKLLSEWLGLAIKHIGGKRKARKALEEFLWPPVMTVKGCRCMLPFQYSVGQLGKKTITYDECTDIPNPQMQNVTGSDEVPGPGWCAVDPDDEDCGMKSSDVRAFIGEGGYGWTHWDVCRSQPPERQDGMVSVDSNVKVITERGCTCQLPFEIYPLNLGGRIRVVSTTCSVAGTESADWCATVGSCGRRGVPGGLSATGNMSWTHWDRCIGEPAGYLASAPKRIKTRQGCYCRDSWKFKPAFFKKAVTYGGCTDIDSPGTAWCAVEGDDCGEASQDPLAGAKGYGWTRWDVCEDAEQPDELVKELQANILPTPRPLVRTQDGCTCKLPYEVASEETQNKAVKMFTCNRYGKAAAWCPVEEADCGKTGSIAGVQKMGWDRWDLCVGEEAGFLPPMKELVKTKQGCVCKLPFKYMVSGEKEVSIFTRPTDIDSPSQPWCAVDPELSDPGCGFKSLDKNAGFAPGKFGWDHWDELPETVTPLARGALAPADVRVQTIGGCTCKLPYKFTPPGVGEELSFSTCNRFEQATAGVTAYWWCLVEEASCGRSGPFGQWDKCSGIPAGYLEPEPVKTASGCECDLPFTYEPAAFARKDCEPNCKVKIMVYTNCTDIDQRGGEGQAAPAWCPTKKGCGKTDRSPRALATGWSSWDTCAVQPDPALQPSAVAPVVRTQNGCRCVFPFKYAPMDTCSFAQEDPAACAAKGGDVVSGWCVICKTETFTSCTYLDQADDTAWCAVEGACGIASKDSNALKSEEQGGYGWTHWDRCIGEAAGYIGLDQPYAKLFPSSSAKATSVHVLHQATAQQGGHAATSGDQAAGMAAVAKAKGLMSDDSDRHGGERGRVGGRERRKMGGGAEGDSNKIKALEGEMAHTLHALNAKLSALDDSPKPSMALSSSRPLPALHLLLAAVCLALAAAPRILP